MINKINVSIGLSAFNEENNIKNLVLSVLNQKGSIFRLMELIVISDGSDDSTVEILKSIKDSRMKVVISKKRRGQMHQLKRLYKTFKGDVLIQTDADCVFANSHIIENMVKSMNEDTNIMMCGGNIIPFEPVSFIEKANFLSTEIYRNYRQDINNGNNIFSVTGPLLAFKKSFVKRLIIPDDILGTDKYMYLLCLKLGYRYKFVSNAIVNYQLPKTLSDYIKQMRRFKKSKSLYPKYFSKEIIDREFKIPLIIFIKYNLLEFIKHPILYLYIAAVNKYCKLTEFKDSSRRGVWLTVQSTK